ncbi:MAG: hypothetical protein GX089_08590 [Fibrobacter sp.]|jgi:hypothetical protein|nr:hypothetical protein [Fibrobacter sp.]HON12300.1 hypothetical protein [Chitinispirillaceae bacterium]
MMPRTSRTVSSLALALGLLTMPVSTSASLSPIKVTPQAGQIRMQDLRSYFWYICTYSNTLHCLTTRSKKSIQEVHSFLSG